MIQQVNYFVSEIKQRLTAARQKASSSVIGTVTGTEELTCHGDRVMDITHRIILTNFREGENI